MASVTGWQTIARSVAAAREQGHRCLVVCSALSGVSNRIDALIERAGAGEDTTDAVQLLRETHAALANELGMELPDAVSDLLDELGRSLDGIRMLGEASPRVRARLMSRGELMSTRLGVAWLSQQGVDVAWADARTLLHTERAPHSADSQHFLAARVEPERDTVAESRLPAASVVLTQGFIAADESGHTVLLGRGGSDTSAACFGVVLGAERVEIWTDVPGLFTANPLAVDAAHQLAELGYDEVAAMASLGARVLHPRCVEPVCQAELPLHVRSTYLPSAEGTVVRAGTVERGIKGVTSRKGLAMLRLCRPSQWQPVGFIADVSACFKQHGLSIDLMSTSPSTITLTVDLASAPRASLDRLVASLQEVAEVTLEHPVASVSVVGTRVRDAFAPLGGVLQQLVGVPVLMVAQGAADHHLTFVVEEDRASDLVHTLHAALFEDQPMQGIDGPRWREMDSAEVRL